MSYFPIILIPPQIEQVKSAQPPVPEPPTPPRQPGSEPKRLDITLIGVETAIAAIGVPVVSQMTSIRSGLLFVLAVGAIALPTPTHIPTSSPTTVSSHLSLASVGMVRLIYLLSVFLPLHYGYSRNGWEAIALPPSSTTTSAIPILPQERSETTAERCPGTRRTMSVYARKLNSPVSTPTRQAQ